MQEMLADVCINSRERIVDKNNVRVAVRGTGDADALFLAAREGDPFLADLCAVLSVRFKHFRIRLAVLLTTLTQPHQRIAQDPPARHRLGSPQTV